MRRIRGITGGVASLATVFIIGIAFFVFHVGISAGDASNTHTFSGTVKDSNGSPIPNVLLDLGSGYTAKTNSTGQYSVVVPAGTYGVGFEVVGQNELPDNLSLTMNLTEDLSASDVTQDFVIPIVNVNVTVKDGAGNPESGRSVGYNGYAGVATIVAGGNSISASIDTNGAGPGATTNANGVATTIFPKGTRFDPGVIQAGYADGTSATNSTTVSALNDVSVEFDETTTHIFSGVVADDKGSPLPNIFVKLGNNAGRTNSSGQFSVVVPAGTYRVGFESISGNELPDNLGIATNLTEDLSNGDVSQNFTIPVVTVSVTVEDGAGNPESGRSVGYFQYAGTTTLASGGNTYSASVYANGAGPGATTNANGVATTIFPKGTRFDPGAIFAYFTDGNTGINSSSVTASSDISILLKEGVPLPATPTDLQAASPTQYPTLTWAGVAGATFYNVYRNGNIIDTISSGNTSYTDNTAPEGSDSYYVTAKNDAGESGQSTGVNVLVDRTAPTITYSVSPAPNSNGWNNSAVTVTFTCADNTKGPSDSGIASCSPPQTESSNGTYAITGTAVDNAGNTSSVSATVKIDLTTPLVGTASWSTNPVVTGNSTTLTVPATPTNGSPIIGGEYYIGSPDPGQGNGTAMTYDGSTGNLTANMPTSLRPGSYIVHIRAQIAAGTWSSTTSATLVVNPLPVAPTITSANNYSIGVRQIITPSNFTFTATGTPTPSLFETGTLPSGLSFTDNGNGTANFTGMVAAGTTGSYTVTIKASSSAGIITQTFTLTITGTASAPTTIFTSTGSDTINATVGVGTSFTFTATGNGNNAKIFIYSGALPAGMNLHDNKDGTASVSGAPTQAGTYTFTVEAQNKQGMTYQQFTVVVN